VADGSARLTDRELGKLKRKSKLPVRNEGRSKETEQIQFEGGIGHRAWICKRRCLVCTAPFSDPAHAVSRGAGGKWFHLVPLCRKHHTEQHDHGLKTFQAKYQVNLRSVARLLAQEHLNEVLGSEAAREGA
jgi:hypothetical protein